MFLLVGLPLVCICFVMVRVKVWDMSRGARDDARRTSPQGLALISERGRTLRHPSEDVASTRLVFFNSKLTFKDSWTTMTERIWSQIEWRKATDCCEKSTPMMVVPNMSFLPKNALCTIAMMVAMCAIHESDLERKGKLSQTVQLGAGR